MVIYIVMLVYQRVNHGFGGVSCGQGLERYGLTRIHDTCTKKTKTWRQVDIYIPSRRCSGRYGMHGPFVVDLPIPRYMVVLVYQRVSNKKV